MVPPHTVVPIQHGGQQIPVGTPASRPVRDEDVKQLQEMFPTLERDIIQSVLEANQGRVDPSVSALLQMTV